MRPAVLFSLAALLTACDLPTQLPRYDTEWELVVVRDSISTNDLLPEHLRAGADGFVIDSFAVESHITLGDVCELCTCFAGPIPALELAPHSWPVGLPPGVLSATLEGGTARVVLHNEVGFDLLDDGEGGRGFLVVALTDLREARVVDELILTDPFPPGDSLVLSFDLAGLVLSPYLVARVHGFIPGSGCSDVALTPESGFRAGVELRNVVASSVDVWMSDRALRLAERSVVLPAPVARRLRTGEADLTVEVDVETRLPAELEIGMSAAGLREDLFTERAALYTPLVISGGTPASPQGVRRLYVVRLDSLSHADHLYLDTRNRFLAPAPLRLTGGESISYQVRLRARVPSR